MKVAVSVSRLVVRCDVTSTSRMYVRFPKKVVVLVSSSFVGKRRRDFSMTVLVHTSTGLKEVAITVSSRVI